MAGEKNRGDIGLLISAVFGWLFSAGILLSMFSLLICKTSMDSSYIGYISSLISFLSAVFAGLYSYRNIKGETFVSSLATALFIVIILLTIGFMVQGKDMTPAGVISVASFTFAGMLVGCNIRYILRKKGKKQIKCHIKKQRGR